MLRAPLLKRDARRQKLSSGGSHAAGYAGIVRLASFSTIVIGSWSTKASLGAAGLTVGCWWCSGQRVTRFGVERKIKAPLGSIRQPYRCNVCHL